MTEGFHTPDGCPVDFYALLPAGAEPAVVHAAVPAGACVLELGCGTGRILRPLAALGHPVYGVDESPAMLAHAAGLPTTCARIEALDLGRTFDAVLLASRMLNTVPAQRCEFLAACRRHVAPHGVVVFQRHPPAWFDTVGPSDSTRDGVRYVVRDVERDERIVHAVIEYHLGGQMWSHAFSTYRIDPDELAADLASADLRFDAWLTPDRSWFTARPRPLR
jgi:SAM-dependent methyltransferase